MSRMVGAVAWILAIAAEAIVLSQSSAGVHLLAGCALAVDG